MATSDDVRAIALSLPGPGYDAWPLVLLHLERVDVARLEELVTDAWRMRGGEPVSGDRAR